ncbi:diguanylate cyclase [Aquabacterium sp.]|uniref:diguanylate cyclase n=1 Tax=Aquabacterium sp. TaxID=1872578 RepID=UPI0037832A57
MSSAAARRVAAGARRLAALLSLALPLAGLAPAWAANSLAAAAAPASPAASAASPAERVAALEFLSRAKPKAALAQLGELLAGLPARDPTRVLVLALRGTLQAQLDDAEAVDLTLRELDALGPLQPLAQAAAGLVRAEQAARRGPARRVERLATDAMAQLPADAPPALRMRLIRTLARAKELTGALDDAVRLRQQQIKLADQYGPGWRRAEARDALADALYTAKQLTQAKALNDEAIAMAHAEGDLVGEARALTTRTFIQTDSGDTTGVLRTMTQVIELTRRAGARGEEVLALANLADYYLRTGEFATALKLSREALPLTREIADPTAESVALANIGLALISLHQRDEGLDYVRQSMAIDERNGALTNLVTIQEELAGYLERAGYLKEAVQVYQQQRKLSDEVYRRDQQQAVLELQEGFDSERRQRELALLQIDNQLKQAQLLTSELQQRVWLAALAVGALLLVLVGLLLLRLRQAGRELSAGNQLLRTQSERDPLTQLANRRYLQRVMNRAANGETGGAFEGALLLIDLDHFKLINDRHGHAAGDAVLVEVARRLRATLRDEDIVVRWGGEEFLVVAQELTQDQLQALAQRLLTAIGGAPVPLPEGVVPVTASIGYAAFPIEPTRLAVGWEQALDLVDTALYLAKAHGRNLAYGVRLVHAQDETELVQISRGLEAAWSAGRVKLTPLRGPAVEPALSTPEALP